MTISNGKRLADGMATWNHLVQSVASPSLTQFALRVALAVPFWRSGILKWDGFLQLNDNAITLFSDEFMLHLPGGPYPFPAPAVTAFLSGCAEVALPLLLVFGLATRTAALGLLIMTLVVQLTVPEGWPVHISWAAMALAVMAWGPGRASIDHAGRRFFHGSKRQGSQSNGERPFNSQPPLDV